MAATVADRLAFVLSHRVVLAKLRCTQAWHGSGVGEGPKSNGE